MVHRCIARLKVEIVVASVSNSEKKAIEKVFFLFVCVLCLHLFDPIDTHLCFTSTRCECIKDVNVYVMDVVVGEGEEFCLYAFALDA